jgi:hypothetical protein
VDGHPLRANKPSRVHAHVAADADHYSLMCFPTPSPTAYLYRRVQAPDGWQGESIAIDGIPASSLSARRRLSRWLLAGARGSAWFVAAPLPLIATGSQRWRSGRSRAEPGFVPHRRPRPRSD